MDVLVVIEPHWFARLSGSTDNMRIWWRKMDRPNSQGLCQLLTRAGQRNLPDAADVEVCLRCGLSSVAVPRTGIRKMLVRYACRDPRGQMRLRSTEVQPQR